MTSFVCLIGTGRWGQNLLRDFHKIKALAAVCEINQYLREKYQKQYPDVKFLADLNEVKNNPQITAICLATPATTHYELAKECLNLGYDLMVEKPLALKYSEGQALVNLAAKKNRILMVGHLLQYHPTINKIKEMIDQDLLGEVQYIKSNRLNLGQIRAGENVLWSFAPHDISIILGFLNNQLPDQIICSGLSALNPPIYDTTTTILRFEKQYAEINVNWLYPYKEQSLVIVGQKGMISFTDSQNQAELYYYPQPVTYDDQGNVQLHKKEPQVIQVDRSKSPLEIECQHFVDCCLKRLTPKTDGAEALRVLAVLELAQKSLDNSSNIMKISDLDTNKYWKHDTAIVDDGAQIGDGTKIWHHSHVMNAKIGRNCSLGQSVFIGNNVVLGDDCRVQNNVNLYDGVICENGVFLGPNCTTTNDKTPRAEFSKNGNYLKTRICKGASVGAGAVLLCGITLGKYCQVGAGAVVTKDVSPYSLVVGNPARDVGTVSDYSKINLEK